MSKTVARYLMYDNEERTKAWRLDVENDGHIAEFYVNGEPIAELPPQVTDPVLQALTALDTAFGNLMLANKPESPQTKEKGNRI